MSGWFDVGEMLNTIDPKIQAISSAYYELSRVLVFLESHDTLTLGDVREARTLVSAANSKLQTLELLLVGVELPRKGD